MLGGGINPPLEGGGVKPKWVRRNLVALWDGQPYAKGDDATRENNMAECDRIMIALHRFQTIGRVEYRRLVGMHGGGGGTSCTNFRDILSAKVDADVSSHYGGNFPDDGYWPNPVPNSPPPELVGAADPDRCFAYTFCWHAEPQFLLWHRPLMAEFERGLQDYDPYFDPLPFDDPARHGEGALGAPYWAWEGWDGITLPQVVSNQLYSVKTDRWKDNSNFPKGSVFNNPFNRWFAPVTIAEQKLQYFPPILTSENSTSRAAAFDDIGVEFEFPWNLVTASKNPSMEDVVKVAMNNPNWNEFCTMKAGVGSSLWSIENAHNKFHNHIGGLVKGGIQGSGVQTDPETENEFTGTMAQNQSIFDPIFWLHHGNVERQFLSWQRRFAQSHNWAPESRPPADQWSTVLYPWTKPDCVWNDELSWNTPLDGTKDAKFSDWWKFEDLPYTYEQFLNPTVPQPYDTPYGIIPIAPSLTPVAPGAPADRDLIRMIVKFDAKRYKGGEYTLFYGSELVGSLSVLSGQGGVCARCSSRSEAAIDFEVSETFKSVQEADKAFSSGKLRLTRNGRDIKITKVEVRKWRS